MSSPELIRPVYSPASPSSSLSQSAKRSPPPAARLIPRLNTDLSQYDALLPQKHGYPLDIVAIFYITNIYDLLYSFTHNILIILQKVNNAVYIDPKIFKKKAIDDLLSLLTKILREQYQYTTLKGTTINIKGNYDLIAFLLEKKGVDRYRIGTLYSHLRIFLKQKYKKISQKDREAQIDYLNNYISFIDTDAELNEYIQQYIVKNKAQTLIIALFKDIDAFAINNKLESIYKKILKVIEILDDIWIDEKAKERFIKYILKTQNIVRSFGGAIGGVGNGTLNKVSQLFKRTNRIGVEPENNFHINRYKRANADNLQNIYDFVSLLLKYIYEIDKKMLKKYMNMINKLKKEYHFLYDVSPQPHFALDEADMNMKARLDKNVNMYMKDKIETCIENMSVRLKIVNNNLYELV
jgi:hypothetical protein